MAHACLHISGCKRTEVGGGPLSSVLAFEDGALVLPACGVREDALAALLGGVCPLARVRLARVSLRLPANFHAKVARLEPVAATIVCAELEADLADAESHRPASSGRRAVNPALQRVSSDGTAAQGAASPVARQSMDGGNAAGAGSAARGPGLAPLAPCALSLLTSPYRLTRAYLAYRPPARRPVRGNGYGLRSLWSA